MLPDRAGVEGADRAADAEGQAVVEGLAAGLVAAGEIAGDQADGGGVLGGEGQGVQQLGEQQHRHVADPPADEQET